MYKYRNIQQIKTNVPFNQLLYAWFIWNRICKGTFSVHISVIYVSFYLLINNKGIKMAKHTRIHLNDRVLFIVHISVKQMYMFLFLLISNSINMAKYTRSHLNDRILVKLINYDNNDYSGNRRLVIVGDSCQMSVINHVIAPTFYCMFTFLLFILCYQVTFITLLNLVYI